MQSIGSEQKRVIDCARKILISEGVTAFWRDTGPRLVRVIVSPQIFSFAEFKFFGTQ